ncbi:MAG: aminoacyl-tRNA hydrolase [Deltaproteobacteria bacterium]|nr:aminoacyl-tRNA hydrolase [Deltaproteobacteria bacterium]
MFLVVGLGNPGARYARTRHNVGFLVVDTLADRWSSPIDRNQLGAEVGAARIPARGPLPEQVAVLAKPQSFMNLSGQPVASLKGYYKVANPDVVVVHDEVDLPFGDIRIKVGGGPGGHNGLRDLVARLGDPGFVRVRFGVGRPPEGWDTADYVLGKWAPEEEARLGAGLLGEAADAVENVIRLGTQAAMNQHNTKPKAPPAPGRPVS